MVKTDLSDAFDGVFGDERGDNDGRSDVHAHADDGGPVRADWHIALDDEDVGPLTLAEVGRHVESGHVDPTTRVWRKGMNEWVAAGDVAEIDALFAAPPIPTQARRSTKTATTDRKNKAAFSARARSDRWIGSPRRKAPQRIGFLRTWKQFDRRSTAAPTRTHRYRRLRRHRMRAPVEAGRGRGRCR